MITFGYKSKFESIVRGVTAIGIGLVMILSVAGGSGEDALKIVAKILAAFLVAAGIVSLVIGYKKRQEGYQNLMNVNAIVDIVLGIIIYFYAAAVAEFIFYLIAFVLVLFGCVQLMALTGAMSLIGAGFPSLIMSILAIVGGIFLFFSPFSKPVMSVIAGVLLIDYGIQELISTYRLNKARKAYEARFGSQQGQTEQGQQGANSVTSSGLDDVKDVDYQKIDEQASNDADAD